MINLSVTELCRELEEQSKKDLLLEQEKSHAYKKEAKDLKDDAQSKLDRAKAAGSGESKGRGKSPAK